MKIFRQIACGTAIACSLLFGEQLASPTQAFAQDVYAYTYGGNGVNIYVETETIRGNSDSFSVTTKEVSGNRMRGEFRYYFAHRSSGWVYTTHTSDPYKSVPSGMAAEAILYTCLQYL